MTKFEAIILPLAWPPFLKKFGLRLLPIRRISYVRFCHLIDLIYSTSNRLHMYIFLLYYFTLLKQMYDF